MVISGRYPAQLSLLFVLKKAYRFLGSMSVWYRARLSPGVIGMVISEQDPTQLAYCLFLQRQGDFLIHLLCFFKKMNLLPLLKKQGAKVIKC